MSFHSAGETEQPQPGTRFLRSELAALQELPDGTATPSDEITAGIIRWYLGEEPTLGQQWVEVHQNPNIGYYNYDTATLTMQNDAARLVALGLAEAGDPTRALHLMDQLQWSAKYEPSSKVGYTHYIRATIAANEDNLEEETSQRRLADTMWNQAVISGEEVSEEELVLRFINVSALAQCEKRLGRSSRLKRTRVIDTDGIL